MNFTDLLTGFKLSWLVFVTAFVLAATTYWWGRAPVGDAEPMVASIAALLALVGALAKFVRAVRLPPGERSGRELRLAKLNESQVRRFARIGFIDDEGAPIAARLRERGYNVFEYREARSAADFSCDRLHVLYLDVTGVASAVHSDLQGAGMARDLRRQFIRPYIIVYSAVAKPRGTEQSKVLRANTDDELMKDEEIGVHLESINQWAGKYFCGANLVEMVEAHAGSDVLKHIDALTLTESLAIIRGATQQASSEARAIRFLAATLSGNLLVEAPRAK